MKSKTELQIIYNNAKGDNKYYSFDDFLKDANKYINIMKKNGKTTCGMQVSRSGMMRKFNFVSFNMLFNICYNNKFSWEPVKVGGCGTDMHFYLKYTVCKMLTTKSEQEKYNLNTNSSYGHIL